MKGVARNRVYESSLWSFPIVLKTARAIRAGLRMGAVYREQAAQGDRTSPDLLQPTRSGWAGQCWLSIQGLRPRDSLLLLPLCLLTWKNWGRCICWLDLLPPLFCSLPVPSLASLFFQPISPLVVLSACSSPSTPSPSSLHAFCCSITYLDNHWCTKTGCTLSRGTGDSR